MERTSQPAPLDGPSLPPDVRLHILSLLPPNDLALGGRLSSKDAAQHFSEPTYRTAHLGQPLPGHAAIAAGLFDSGQTALRQLTFQQKLHLPATAAASGCEANVDFALQLLQPHVFPGLLQADHGYAWLREGLPIEPERYGIPDITAAADLGSAALASGLAHLLPSLAQRCPALLDPGRTLEAAARHCDLAGLQAAWEVLGQRLLSSIEGNAPDVDSEDDEYYHDDEWEQQALQRIMAEAAASPTPDAIAKMAWVLETCSAHGRLPLMPERVWGAAAASGDLARLRWLREHGCPWQSDYALSVVLRHASLPFLREMEQQGHLPPAGDAAWRWAGLNTAAGTSRRDCAAKLRWLAGRGADVVIDCHNAIKATAFWGNLEALQLLLECWRERKAAAARINAPGSEASVGGNPLDGELLYRAVMGGHVAIVAWLVQAGCPLQYPLLIMHAIYRGDLPMARWLLEAGCPRGQLTLADLVQYWPSRTAADSGRLVEAVRLMAAAGVPAQAYGKSDPYHAAAAAGQPWAVWRVLREVLPVLPAPGDERGLPYSAVQHAAHAARAVRQRWRPWWGRGCTMSWWRSTTRLNGMPLRPEGGIGVHWRAFGGWGCGLGGGYWGRPFRRMRCRMRCAGWWSRGRRLMKRMCERLWRVCHCTLDTRSRSSRR